MSISSALNNAITGLTATSRLAEVVSSNLSNALTEGYGRRSVDLSAAQVGSRGGGVRIDGISRFSDPGLLADRRLADATLSGQQITTKALIRLENDLGGADGATGLAARFAAFERAMISASSDPASETRLESAVSRLSDVVGALKSATGNIGLLRQDADAAIANDVQRLNANLQKVASLNKDILRINASGNDPSGLLDARQKIVDELAAILPIREIPRDNGTIALMTTNGTSLIDGRPVRFGFERTPTITADMTLASGALSGLTLNNVPVDPATGIGRLGGGTLGANFALRDQVLPQIQNGLDQIAADLIARFEDPTNDATLVAGTAGILTDQGGPLDLADLPGLAGRISLNAFIDPAQGGNTTLLRDGLNASVPGTTGNSSQLNNWIASLAAPRSDVTGASMRTAAGRIADFTADVGIRRLAHQELTSFAAAKWDSLRQAELANGVDTDFELQVLLRVEQAYAANAKIIQSVNLMMQQLLEI